jgi:protein-glutamine gamma-glutamyltransferase
MRPPPFLLGAALLFWGWQAELFWVGLAAAVALEGSHLLRVRWEFAQPDLDRVWNFCVALFLGATVYVFFSGENVMTFGDLVRENSPASRLATLNQSKRSLFLLLQWLPAMFLPIALVQAYAQQERLDMSTFSWWLRRQRNDPRYTARYGMLGLNVGYPFFACTLFAASAANQRSLWFTVGLVGLVAWALWLHRSRAFGSVRWALSVVLALALGLGLHWTMLEVQKLVQRLDEVLLAKWGGSRQFNAKENQTRLGSVGRMKLSGRMVMRVDPKGQPAPALLREASYNLFHAPYWSSSSRHFEQVTPDTNLTSWLLQPSTGKVHSARISGYLPTGTGLLAVPLGSGRLDHLPAMALTTNVLGAVRVEDGPGFVAFDSIYSDAPPFDAHPSTEDLDVPRIERSAVHATAERLQLDRLDDEAVLQTIHSFFAQNFAYTLDLGRQHQPSSNRTALARFLLENRSGHCEYFATATVLLLRAAHIPARYATGFAVQERQGKQYVVRERHAHAWCLAWIGDRWREVDTTPASWGAMDAQRASSWEPIRDLWSRAWFEFSRWRWGHAEWKKYLPWLVAPVLVFALGRLLIHRQWTRSANARANADTTVSWPGLDSEFYRIEERLQAAGLARQPGETGAAWISRVSQSGLVPVDGLDALLGSHYRLRFHPRGLAPAERAHLQQQTAAWLDRADRPV